LRRGGARWTWRRPGDAISIQRHWTTLANSRSTLALTRVKSLLMTPLPTPASPLTAPATATRDAPTSSHDANLTVDLRCHSLLTRASAGYALTTTVNFTKSCDHSHDLLNRRTATAPTRLLARRSPITIVIRVARTSLTNDDSRLGPCGGHPARARREAPRRRVAIVSPMGALGRRAPRHRAVDNVHPCAEARASRCPAQRPRPGRGGRTRRA
jgi:hypothetical protein